MKTEKSDLKIGDMVTVEGYWEVVALEKKFDGRIYAKLEGPEKECNFLSVFSEHLTNAPGEPDYSYVATDGSC